MKLKFKRAVCNDGLLGVEFIGTVDYPTVYTYMYIYIYVSDLYEHLGFHRSAIDLFRITLGPPTYTRHSLIQFDKKENA